MTRPIESAVILSQVQTALEMLQTAQREAALARLRHESDTDRAKTTDHTTVTRQDEVVGRTIRDSDPRRRQPQRQRTEDDEDEDQERTRPTIDIIV